MSYQQTNLVFVLNNVQIVYPDKIQTQGSALSVTRTRHRRGWSSERVNFTIFSTSFAHDLDSGPGSNDTSVGLGEKWPREVSAQRLFFTLHRIFVQELSPLGRTSKFERGYGLCVPACGTSDLSFDSPP